MSNHPLLGTNLTCPHCDSSRGLAVYGDNSTHCHKCRRSTNDLTDTQVSDLLATQQTQKKRNGTRMTTSPDEFSYAGQATFRDLEDRGIKKATCEVYGVKSLRDPETGKYIHCYPFFDKDKNLIAQKVRDFRVDKKARFHMKIDSLDDRQFSEAVPFGLQAFDMNEFPYITICEGEADAMACYELLGSKFPVLSVNTGSGSAKRELSKWSNILEKAKKIVLCFDNDKAGQDAAKECQELFFETDCVIMTVPRDLKDSCDVLAVVKGLPKPDGTPQEADPTIMDEFQKAFWRAKEWRPEGLISGADAFEIMCEEDDTECIASPWAGLDEKTCGFRGGELWTWTAGSGQGKSQIIREIIEHLYSKTEWRMGVMMMEESIKKTCMSLAGVHCSLPLHLLTVKGDDEQKQKYKSMAIKVGSEMFKDNSERWEFKDHFGSSSVDEIARQVRYLAKTKMCKVVFLDHLSIIVSSQENGDERKAIDEVMTKLVTTVAETGIQLHIISHLKRPQGKGHEEGGITSLAELRGSASIAQLSDMVISLERDQQAEDEFVRNTTLLRVLKNRFSGETGEACLLNYSKATGRMLEVSKDKYQEYLGTLDENQNDSPALNKFKGM